MAGSRPGGWEVILGTAASVAETLGYPGWWLGLKAAECLIGVTQSTHWTSESRRPVRRRCGSRRPVQQSLPWLPCRQTKPSNCLRRR